MTERYRAGKKRSRELRVEKDPMGNETVFVRNPTRSEMKLIQDSFDSFEPFWFAAAERAVFPTELRDVSEDGYDDVLVFMNVARYATTHVNKITPKMR